MAHRCTAPCTPCCLALHTAGHRSLPQLPLTLCRDTHETEGQKGSVPPLHAMLAALTAVDKPKGSLRRTSSGVHVRACAWPVLTNLPKSNRNCAPSSAFEEVMIIYHKFVVCTPSWRLWRRHACRTFAALCLLLAITKRLRTALRTLIPSVMDNTNRVLTHGTIHSWLLGRSRPASHHASC